MKITRIDTIEFDDSFAMPGLLLVQVHTDEDLTGTGETFYLPGTCAEAIHEFLAPRLLGGDPRRVTAHWTTIAKALQRFGGQGAEWRALSAIDVALWDIVGQAAGVPVYQLLGGAMRDGVRVYNTCGGPRYAHTRRGGAPGEGTANAAGKWDDLIAARTDAGALAEDLLSEGFRGMKIWPWDELAIRQGGAVIDADGIEEGLRSVRQVRDAVGDRIEIMIEGHGLWELGPAKRIASALEPFRPAWLEDLVLADVRTLASLRASTSIPVSASEYLVNRAQFHAVMEARAADFLMIDPTWAGGVTESHRIAELGDAYGLPVTFHDCTGPITLVAGIHLGMASPNAVYQEVVRAFLRTIYGELVTDLPQLDDGWIRPSGKPGLGTALNPDVARRPDVRVRSSAV